MNACSNVSAKLSPAMSHIWIILKPDYKNNLTCDSLYKKKTKKSVKM